MTMTYSRSGSIDAKAIDAKNLEARIDGALDRSERRRLALLGGLLLHRSSAAIYLHLCDGDESIPLAVEVDTVLEVTRRYNFGWSPLSTRKW